MQDTSNYWPYLGQQFPGCWSVVLARIDNRIAGNFRERKLLRIGEKYDFRGENFRRLLTFAAPKVPHPQILRRKLSRIATKLRNSRKFSPSKVSRYTV